MYVLRPNAIGGALTNQSDLMTRTLYYQAHPPEGHPAAVLVEVEIGKDLIAPLSTADVGRYIQVRCGAGKPIGDPG